MPKLTKLENELARALHRSIPVESCHQGRGMLHAGTCWRTCYDSWTRDVNEIAWVLTQRRKTFNKEEFFRVCGKLEQVRR